MALAPEDLATLKAVGERARNRPCFRDLAGTQGRCLAIVEGEPGPEARCCGEPVEGRGALGHRSCAGHRVRLILAA